MEDKKIFSVSVIMPVYNGETTVIKTLESLLSQAENISELIIINDCSKDNSKEIIKKFITDKINFQLIDNEKNLGLANSYNKGILLAKGDLMITLHQDVILMPGAVEKLIEPFKDEDVVASAHLSIFPFDEWKKFGFWQKVFFSRFVGKKYPGLNGQFDCFRTEILKKIGMFDGRNFRSAGEDSDIIEKLKKEGKIAQTDAEMIHLQNLGSKFSWKDIVFKQKQHSEAHGALLALGKLKGTNEIIKTFFREILVITLFIPYLNVISLVSIFLYSFWYTKKMFVAEYRNPRIILIPILNIYLLFVSLVYSLEGFIYGKQKL